jgi:hypothetical protein
MSQNNFNLRLRGFDMKTYTLKYKSALMAIALLASLQSPLSHTNPTTEETVRVETLADQSENEFFELMINRIKVDGIEAVFQLLQILSTESLLAKEKSYDMVIKRLKDRLAIITNKILNPIETKLELLKRTQPNSRFSKILEKVKKLADELAHKELKNLLDIFEAHKKSPDAKKATAFIGKIKAYRTKFTSSGMIKELEEQLKAIYTLIQEEHLAAIDKLNKEEIVTDIKKKFSIIENNFKAAGLFTAWSNLLKTI